MEKLTRCRTDPAHRQGDGAGGWPKSQGKASEMAGCFFFLWVFEVLFCGFSYFPPQVRFWITWSLRLAVGPGSKFFGAADPSFICESNQTFER